MSKEAYVYGKRGLFIWQKRPTNALAYLRYAQVSKDTYKRDLLRWQKRPTALAKETYCSVKRDLLRWQKRPTALSKETY